MDHIIYAGIRGGVTAQVIWANVWMLPVILRGPARTSPIIHLEQKIQSEVFIFVKFHSNSSLKYNNNYMKVLSSDQVFSWFYF